MRDVEAEINVFNANPRFAQFRPVGDGTWVASVPRGSVTATPVGDSEWRVDAMIPELRGGVWATRETLIGAIAGIIEVTQG